MILFPPIKYRQLPQAVWACANPKVLAKKISALATHGSIARPRLSEFLAPKASTQDRVFSPRSSAAISPAQTDPMTTAMDEVIASKRSLKTTTLNNKLERYNPILLADDLFTTAYLGFQGIQAFVPSMSTITPIITASLVCGVVAGVINIGVGLVYLHKSIEMFRSGDKIQGFSRLLDGIGCVGIGIIMILASLAIKVSALAGIGALLAANPWLLPLFFFISLLPLLGEVCYRMKDILTKNDLGSKLQLDQLNKLLQADKPDWKLVQDICNKTFKVDPKEGEDLRMALSRIMEEWQMEIGVSAALDAFTLMKLINEDNKEAALAQIEVVKKEIAVWNNSIYLKLLQQVIGVIGCAMSLGALAPNANANLWNGMQSFFLSATNGIPLYMDLFWPFSRIAPMVVPSVHGQIQH